ncbi:hypothetical protein BAY61_30190 [Prauserella marina]|uniref:Uncharacterized protein n=1 Tax=Prauserella marina TaxID=530584 RepID=A0A222VXD2_9PSEU|nr:hypothetical protein [Prauserella marina]ASR38560.1 hypothetical protein BAY61_30190 [Prauserella marina]PWV81873.1 hypothetical protein DES30_102106 [Prauserella marina]SDD14294.1 hypothetical protein SAMN05421630_106106 [Prauserella marina]
MYPTEVEDVLYTRPRLTSAGRDDLLLVFGTSEAGRYLLVVLSEALDGRWYVVTARDMTLKERQAFQRKARWR